MRNPQLIGEKRNKLGVIRSASNKKTLQRRIKDNLLDNLFDNPRKIARITHELRTKLRASYRQVTGKLGAKKGKILLKKSYA